MQCRQSDFASLKKCESRCQPPCMQSHAHAFAVSTANPYMRCQPPNQPIHPSSPPSPSIPSRHTAVTTAFVPRGASRCQPPCAGMTRTHDAYAQIEKWKRSNIAVCNISRLVAVSLFVRSSRSIEAVNTATMALNRLPALPSDRIGCMCATIHWNDTEMISMAPCARMTRTNRKA